MANDFFDVSSYLTDPDTDDAADTSENILPMLNACDGDYVYIASVDTNPLGYIPTKYDEKYHGDLLKTGYVFSSPKSAGLRCTKLLSEMSYPVPADTDHTVESYTYLRPEWIRSGGETSQFK